jgi:hypothetical protein
MKNYRKWSVELTSLEGVFLRYSFQGMRRQADQFGGIADDDAKRYQSDT